MRRLADVGCGTGNYAVALNDAACSVIGCDLSFGMLTVARPKRSAGGHPGLVQCDIGFSLPFQSETLDVVTCIQVLHHLDEPGHNYLRHRQLMSEVSRVLSRGGLLIVNTITHDQLRDGVWWGELIEPAVVRMSTRFASIPALCAMADAWGLEVVRVERSCEATIQSDEYSDCRSIRSKRFRDGDPHFSLLSAEELAAALARLDEMEAAGAIDTYLAEREQLRRDLGQSTFLVAKKR